MSTKYQVVADAIRERIENGTYKIDELIPDQNALAQEFHVNRLTVKKALDGLAAEGLIYKQSGLGTYVRGKIPFITPHDVSSTTSAEHSTILAKNIFKAKSFLLTSNFQMNASKRI